MLQIRNTQTIKFNIKSLPGIGRNISIKKMITLSYEDWKGLLEKRKDFKS